METDKYLSGLTYLIFNGKSIFLCADYALITHYKNVLPCPVTRIPEGDTKSPKNELLKFTSLYTIVFSCF